MLILLSEKGVPMFWKKSIAIVSSFVFLLVSACNLPGGPAVVDDTNLDPNLVAQTQVAELVASTAAAQTSLANAVASTLAAMATNTPEFTFTPSLTSTPSSTSTSTYTLTPSVPMVSVSVETNCRTGPGTAYDILGILPVGQTAEVIGRSPGGDTWIIRLPSNPSINCWLWGQYATVNGNTSDLPVYTPPPTPTPPATFTISYLQTVTCAGMYAFRFQLTNNGSVTWRSIKVDVTDSTTAITKTFSDDYFTDYTGCGAFTNQLTDLEPAESGVAGNWAAALLAYNPAGHNITATITLCSLDGMVGPCTSKSIGFTP
jgi:hypothetical protein